MSDEYADLLGDDNPITRARDSISGLAAAILECRDPCPRCGGTDRFTMVAPGQRVTSCDRCGKTLEDRP